MYRIFDNPQDLQKYLESRLNATQTLLSHMAHRFFTEDDYIAKDVAVTINRKNNRLYYRKYKDYTEFSYPGRSGNFTLSWYINRVYCRCCCCGKAMLRSEVAYTEKYQCPHLKQMNYDLHVCADCYNTDYNAVLQEIHQR